MGVRKPLTFASALLASNVPDAGNCIAVLALTEDGATTAVIEVAKGINTLVVTTDQARDRASGQTLRARRNIARGLLTLLGFHALLVALSTLAVTASVIAVPTPSVPTLVTITRLPGRSRELRVGGSGWRIATEGSGAPIPTIRALGRRDGIRGLVRSTAALFRVPRPVEGAVGVSGWFGRVARPSLGETAVLCIPPKNQHRLAHPSSPRQGRDIPELTISTAAAAAATPAAVGEDEGNGQNQEKDTSSERHLQRWVTQTKDGVGGEGDEPETEKKRRETMRCSRLM